MYITYLLKSPKNSGCPFKSNYLRGQDNAENLQGQSVKLQLELPSSSALNRVSMIGFYEFESLIQLHGRANGKCLFASHRKMCEAVSWHKQVDILKWLPRVLIPAQLKISAKSLLIKLQHKKPTEVAKLWNKLEDKQIKITAEQCKGPISSGNTRCTALPFCWL